MKKHIILITFLILAIIGISFMRNIGSNKNIPVPGNVFGEDIEINITRQIHGNLSEMEMLAYFMELYPNMDRYDVYLRDGEHTYEDVFRRISEEGIKYYYFTRQGKNYIVTDTEEKKYLITDICKKAGYSYFSSFSFEKKADGTISLYDENNEIKFMQRDIGTGVLFSFYLKRNPDRERRDGTLYDIEIYREGESEPFQVIQAVSYLFAPVSFDDYNADGYTDLRILEDSAQNSIAAYYFWVPSKGKFERGPEEIEYGTYKIDSSTRRFYKYIHGSAVEGEEYTYQWKNETDYELLKSYAHWSEYDNENNRLFRVTIKTYENGNEKILSDYAYDFDEYFSAGFIEPVWLYCYDTEWEYTIESAVSKEKYILYYIQEPMYDDNEKNFPEYYVNFIYVMDEDTRIVKCLKWQNESEYDMVLWDDGILINYKDTNSQTYGVKELFEE